MGTFQEKLVWRLFQEHCHIIKEGICGKTNSSQLLLFVSFFNFIYLESLRKQGESTNET